MNYFGKYHSLYEAKINPMEQNKIADAGADVEEDNLDNGGAIPEDGQQDMNNPDTQQYVPDSKEPPVPDELDDANYMQAEAPQEQPADDDKYKKMKLFALFRNMMNYVESLLKTLENVDLSTLDDEKIRKIENAKTILNTTLTKIKEYMVDIYSEQTYEQGLYVYVLLRSELLTGISIIRENLDLNQENDKKE